MPEPARIGEKIYRGISVSAGVCRGKILVLGQTAQHLPERCLSEEEIPQEIQRLFTEY